MKRRAILAAFLAAFLAFGCEGSKRVPSQTEPAAGPVDADLLWSAAVEAVSARFAISSAEKDKGTIRTDFLVGPLSQTGFRVNVAGGDVPAEVLRTYRRKATVTILPDGTPLLAVVVEKQVMVREQEDAVPSGTFSMDSPEEQVNMKWVSAGRDTALEDTLRAEILAAYGL